MKLSVLFENASLAYPQEFGDIEISCIVTDSRKVIPSALFLCLRGTKSDGHDHIREAIDKGATVVVTEGVRDGCVGGAATISIENTRIAASLLYSSWFGNPQEKLRLIAVTGTNGKTSVSHMIRSILRRAGRDCALIGTVGCFSADDHLIEFEHDPLSNMTTPDPEGLFALLSQFAREGVRDVVMEVTSHALSWHKVDALRFEVGVFTNLTRDHLDFHGDIENYFEAKARLFSLCRRGVICLDDEWGQKLMERLPEGLAVSVGEDPRAMYRVTGVRSVSRDGYDFTLRGKAHTRELFVASPARFFVTNAALAAVTAEICGADEKSITEGIALLRGVPGRMERVELPKEAPFCAYLDYAHTPDALEKLLESLREMRERQGRILLLFGCGGERDRGKRRQMGRIATQLADLSVVTADNSRGEPTEEIIRDILKGIDKEKPYCVIPDRRDAIAFLVESARKDDILVLAGKGHETYEINATGRHPFDEREILLRAYERVRARKR